MLRDLDARTAIITFFGFLVALTMHEASHAFAAKALGDNSSQTNYRATINPIPHIDVFGTLLFPLMMLFSGIPFLFGWAKPYTFDTRMFKKPRRDINLATIAGPLVNFAIAALCLISFRFVGSSFSAFTEVAEPSVQLLQSTAIANIVIGVLNLVPFPNSDGWRLITNNVNYNLASKLEGLATPISLVMLLLLIMGVFHPLIMFVINLFTALFA